MSHNLPTGVRSLDFGPILRRYRLDAGLTQEELAEQARLSPRAISDLERGARRAPRRDTVALLVEALHLAPEDRTTLEGAASAARRKGAATPDASDTLRASASASTPGIALPRPLTPLVGREQEVAALTLLLQQNSVGIGIGVRLLTLTGPGGVGKTRLAMQVAADMSGHFADGVVVVPLAAIGDATLIPAAIATALGLRETSGRPLNEAGRGISS